MFDGIFIQNNTLPLDDLVSKGGHYVPQIKSKEPTHRSVPWDQRSERQRKTYTYAASGSVIENTKPMTGIQCKHENCKRFGYFGIVLPVTPLSTCYPRQYRSAHVTEI